MRDCGDCSICCKLITIVALEKPQGVWCKYCAPKRGEFGGCTIHESRPQVCRDFFCLWSRGLGDDALRPDRSKVIFLKKDVEGIPTVVAVVHPDYPMAWKGPKVQQMIDALCGKGHRIMITVDDKAFGVGAWT